MTLRDLHEAAYMRSGGLARWTAVPNRHTNALTMSVYAGEWFICYATPEDAALIVALRNAYASGTLVERERYDALLDGGAR